MFGFIRYWQRDRKGVTAYYSSRQNGIPITTSIKRSYKCNLRFKLFEPHFHNSWVRSGRDPYMNLPTTGPLRSRKSLLWSLILTRHNLILQATLTEIFGRCTLELRNTNISTPFKTRESQSKRDSGSEHTFLTTLTPSSPAIFTTKFLVQAYTMRCFIDDAVGHV